jgi:replicative DNA helicase
MAETQKKQNTNHKTENLSSLVRNYNTATIEKKIVPNALDAERAVLGSLLQDKDAIIKIADLLLPEDFYHDHHKFIYECCLSLFHNSEPIDLVTTSTKLQGLDKLEVIGGPEYLAEITNEVPIASHVFQYAQIVKHRATLRKLIKAGTDIMALGYDMEKKSRNSWRKRKKRIFFNFSNLSP